MSLEYQETVKELAGKHGPENLVVVLGFLDLQLIAIYAATLIFGDISYSGSLSGVELRLEVHHILELEVKAQIPEDIYQTQMGLVEITTGPEKIEQICRLLEKIKTIDPSKLLEFLEETLEN